MVLVVLERRGEHLNHLQQGLQMRWAIHVLAQRSLNVRHKAWKVGVKVLRIRLAETAKEVDHSRRDVPNVAQKLPQRRSEEIQP